MPRKEQQEKKIKDYQEALKLGEVLVAYARVMMVGPGGVGKSSFLRGLMNQSLPQDAESTILADSKTVKPQYWVKAGKSADSYWAEVTDQDEIEELAGLLVLAKLHPSKAAGLGEFNTQGCKPQGLQTISREDVSHIKDNEVRNVLQQVAEHTLSQSKNSTAPQSEVLIHVWDCGGQPVFLDVLLPFLTSRTMFLLFFDARQDLHEICKTLAYKEGKVVSESDLCFTTLQLHTQWMASIHAMHIRKSKMKYTNPEGFTKASEDESPAKQGRMCTSDAVYGHKGQENSARNQQNGGEDTISKFPRIVPVGTHGDYLTVQEKEGILHTLHSSCEGTAFTPFVFKGVIVDNTTAGRGRQGEDKGFKYIRETVHKFASKHLAIPTPVAWVLFRKVLQKVAKGNPIVSYERAVAVGQACGIAEDVVPSVLYFYHELAVFLHFTQIESLSDKVIVDPQWLVTQLGRLLAPEGLEEQLSNQLLWELLHKKGILVQYLYDEVWEESNLKCKIQPQSLFDLLNHFHLAAPISVTPYKGRKYFVPSVLKLSLHDTDSTPEFRELVKISSPLHLTFSTQYVPPGFFTRLATTLTGKPKCDPLFKRGVFRNKITFAYDQIDEFTICEQFSSVQINVVRIQHRNSDKIMTFGNTCCDIRELIQECSATVRQWLPSVEVNAAFLCEQCPDFITIPHGAETGLKLRCKAGHSCYLTKEKQYWLKIPCTPKHLAEKSDLSDAELQGVACDVQRNGKLEELADELEMVSQLEPLQHDVNAPLKLLRRWRVEKENGLEAHSYLVHHLKCIGLTGTSHSLYYREFLSPSRTNPIADNTKAARDSYHAHEIVTSVHNTSKTTRGQMLVSQDDQYALHLLPTIQEPPYHQLSYQHTQPWIYRQESFTGVAAPASTGAWSQPHSSTMTDGYVQQVPYQKDDAQTWHSELGHVPSHSYHHYHENSDQLTVCPTHQPTYYQLAHPGYPPPGHQYPPQHVCHYEHPPPPQLPPTDGLHLTSFPPHQYTGPQVQGSSYQGTKPTLPELLKFTCTDDRVLNIPVEVATKYVNFGIFLLDDRTGSRVKIIAHKNHNDAEQINIAILQEWLTGKGKQPVTWTTLIEVLRDIELSTLAGDIEAVKCRGRPTPKDQS